VAYETAVTLAEEARDVSPRAVAVLTRLADAHAVLALVSDSAGAPAHATAARSVLASVERMNPAAPDDLFIVANTHEELGDRAGALEWLAKAVKAGYPLTSVRRSPWLKSLRDDPQFSKRFPQG